VVGWLAAEHPGKFSKAELSAQWARFRRWHRGEKTRSADWAGRFESWLTNGFYRPLVGEARRAAETLVVRDEPPPEMDEAEWAQMLEDCEKMPALGCGRAAFCQSERPGGRAAMIFKWRWTR